MKLQSLFTRVAAIASGMELGDENSLKPNKAQKHARLKFESSHTIANGRSVTKRFVGDSAHENFRVGDERPLCLKVANGLRPDRVRMTAP